MRQIKEDWTGIGFAVEQGEQQRVSPEGFPMTKPDGSPDMEPVMVLVFVHQTEECQRVIRVSFAEESKQKLIQALTGTQLVIAGANDMPTMH